MQERIRIFNIEVDNITEKQLLEEFTEGVLVTPNVDHLIKLQKDKEFWELYKKADYITVDSQIVKLVLKFFGTPKKVLKIRRNM